MHFGKNSMPRLHDLMSTDITNINQCTVTLDWSAYDANTPQWVLKDAFDVLETLIDFNAMSVTCEDRTI